jgi:hypothetical protein
MAGGEPAMSRAGVWRSVACSCSLSRHCSRDALARCPGSTAKGNSRARRRTGSRVLHSPASTPTRCRTTCRDKSRRLKTDTAAEGREPWRYAPARRSRVPYPARASQSAAPRQCDGYGWRPGRTTRKCCTTSRMSTLVVDPGRWQLAHTRRNASEAYRPVMPPTAFTPAATNPDERPRSPDGARGFRVCKSAVASPAGARVTAAAKRLGG